MSTSDPGSLVLGEEQARTSALELPVHTEAPTDAFSPAVIARIANELFAELPDSLSLPMPPIPSEEPSLSTVPSTAPAFQPEVQLPSDKHFPTAPASAGPAHASPVSAQYQAAPPAIPGAWATAAEQLPDDSANFSFLQDARLPASTSPATVSAPAVPAAKAGSEAAMPTSDFYLPSKVFDENPLSTPSFAGIPYSSETRRSPVPVFSFFEELRPLTSNSPSIPGPVPAGFGVPWDDISSFDLGLSDDYQRSPELADSAGSGSFGFLEGARPLDLATPTSSSAAGLDQNVPRDLDLTAYPFDAASIKRDFPILQERVNGRSLVWLDNAATTQKPQSVIDRISYFYEHENSNVHRAAHELAARATDAYEAAREKVRRFVNASSTSEIIFVRGATEGINLIANTWGRRNIGKDDEIVITWLEHHANIVPWQMLCSETGAKLRVAPVDDSGQLLLDEYEKLLGPRTRLVSFTQVSNALGVITPAAQIIEAAQRYGAKVLLDGAQSVSHMRSDVQTLDCDFFVFSGHKVFGPTGIGVVYGKPEILEHMPPWQGGGNMIQDVTFEKTTFQRPPQRFEAGTGNIADAVGLGAAIDYLDRVGMHNIARHEHELLAYATAELSRVPGLTIVGTAKEKAGVLSFVLDGFRTEDVGSFLNQHGIAVRSGHHCAQPILRRFGYESTVRASLALYNTREDIDRLVAAIWDLRLGRGSIA
jgi:cysteine desulfurase / selenocysteine lyase